MDRTFGCYLAARSISVVGSSVTLVALPVLSYQLTGSASMVGLAATATALPTLVFGAPAGAIADRFRRRPLMLVSSLGSGCAIGSVPVASAIHLLTLPHVLIAAFLSGAFGVLFDASNLAALPALFPGDRLTRVMSAVWTVNSLADLGGLFVASALLTLLSPAYGLAIDGVSFGLSAVLLLAVRGRFEEPRSARPRYSTRALAGDMVEGLRALWQRPALRISTVAVAGMTCTFGTVIGLIAVYAVQVLHSTHQAQETGYLSATGSIGALVAAVALPRVLRRGSVTVMAMVGLALNVIGVVLLATASGPVLGYLAMGLFGSSFSLVSMNIALLRQRSVPDRLRGRVNMGARILGSSLARSVGTSLGGALIALVSIRLTYLVMMVGVGGALVLCLATRFWRHEPGRGGPDVAAETEIASEAADPA